MTHQINLPNSTSCPTARRARLRRHGPGDGDAVQRSDEARTLGGAGGAPVRANAPSAARLRQRLQAQDRASRARQAAAAGAADPRRRVLSLGPGTRRAQRAGLEAGRGRDVRARRLDPQGAADHRGICGCEVSSMQVSRAAAAARRGTAKSGAIGRWARSRT